MDIAGYDVPNELVLQYARIVKAGGGSPTLARDYMRLDIHNEILASVGVTRHNHVFMGALSDTLMELIQPC